jgi:hypothetical protein
MLNELKSDLTQASGQSEFVFSVFCDIRGFSEFSTRRESPDTAMFIKRFYLQLITEYFPFADFAKTTGDGMLLVFNYNEYNLKEKADAIILAALRCLSDFPQLFTNDPMINFSTPDKLGFGIARGTACRLHSNMKTIDFSGQIINLSARLTDLARPLGLVIDGQFQIEILSADLISKFAPQEAYIRSIAEDRPRSIYVLSGVTELPSHSLSPIKKKKLQKTEHNISVKEMKSYGILSLNLEPNSTHYRALRLQLSHPSSKVNNYTDVYNYKDFKLEESADGAKIEVQTKAAQAIIKSEKLTDDVIFNLIAEYE